MLECHESRSSQIKIVESPKIAFSIDQSSRVGKMPVMRNAVAIGLAAILIAIAFVACSKPSSPVAEQKSSTTPPAPTQPSPIAEEPPPKPVSPKATTRPPKPVHQRPTSPTPQEAAAQIQNDVGRYSIVQSEADREALVDEIGDLKDSVEHKEQVAQALTTLFRMEASPAVRAEIMTQLGDLEHTSAVDPIQLGLDPNQPQEVQDAATEAWVNLLQDLVDAEDPAAFDQMVRALQPTLPRDVREAGIDGLEDLDDKRAVPILQQLLHDNDSEVREYAKDALDWLNTD